MKFEDEFDRLLEEQIRTAEGQRLDMLRKDKTGEKKLFCEALRPVLHSLEGIVLKYEVVSNTGVRIYYDSLFRWAVECLGFVPHAQNITRDRFDFELVRICTAGTRGITYMPFSWDQLDKKPEYCRRTLYELIGRQTVLPGNAYRDLTIYERETIRYALYLNRTFKLNDVQECTQRKEDACRQILRGMLQKGLIKSVGRGASRLHDFALEPKATHYVL
ncbi:hypothetical protein GE107_11585 [Cohnella sp. CFH 77786]|uniref:hypothetical protein n=1 Tax=Cohnella sp. CFH 77786 TaxID=2662265 RepID=UPI001C60D068|nr:hypothetical protein [Cohnella sp. CFH 77786]MBW5446703.1 hypothetical protein [Cohnella sp. CFH 77786]